MNIVIISSYNSPERFLIHEVQKIYPDAVVIEPASFEEKKSRWAFIKKVKNPMHLWPGINFKIQRELWTRAFYADKNFPEIKNRIQFFWPHLNKQAGLELLARLNPDILVSVSAPILKPELLEIPKIAAVNIHYGNVPYYRGNDTIFWALYNNDFDKIGGTIHHLSEGVDSGNILAEIFPELEPSDGQISIEVKLTKLLAKSLIAFLKTAEAQNGNLAGRPQNGTGRNFKRIERTLPKTFFYLLKRAGRFSRPPHKDEQIRTWF